MVKRKIYSEVATSNFPCAVWAMISGRRVRHSKYLTKSGAESFAKLLRTKRARKAGFSKIEIKCKRRKK